MTKSRFQQTIRRPFNVNGRGYWSGRSICLTFRPLPSDSGIQFQRIDMASQPTVEALASNSRETALRTRLVGFDRDREFQIDMIEHVVSALSGMAVDNCLVQCDGEEMPGLDGSSYAISSSIQACGVHVQKNRIREMPVHEPIRVGNIDQWVEARPKRGFVPTFEYRCDFGDEFPIAPSIVSTSLKPADYLSEVSPARTFIRESDAIALQNAGIAKHVTYRDLIVLDGNGPIQNQFRYDDECARHKLLDLIGDIALCGVKLDADIIAYRSSHALNGKLALQLQRMAADHFGNRTDQSQKKPQTQYKQDIWREVA